MRRLIAVWSAVWILAGTAVCRAEAGSPLLVVPAGDATAPVAQWAAIAADLRWKLSIPTGDLNPLALKKAVEEAREKGGVDANRVYLLGIGDAAPAVFYAVSRLPQIWAAAVAVNGNLRALIQSNHLFAANSRNVPLLWLLNPETEKAEAWSLQRLKDAGFRFEVRQGEKLTLKEPLDWFEGKRRNPAPKQVECETGLLPFTRCYWLEIAKVDPAQKNDVLQSTRVKPGSGASLAAGNFGYNPAAPGPGVVVSWLPPDYQGPLKLEDRILSLGGKAIADAAGYERLLDPLNEERPIALVVQRGRERLRIETRVVIARRDENFTAQIRGEFNPETRDLFVITRGVGEVKLNLPEEFVPAKVNWNGNQMGDLDKAGCYMLGAKATPCASAPAEAK